MPDPSLTYDVVMATCNRPEAVALSIPLLLAQSRKPARIIIVDSSDDGAPIEAIATRHGQDGVPVDYIRAERGLTAQRNIGLARCTSDVVLFPDDDSLLYTDTAEELMKIYEADGDGCIAAVCARAVDRPPPETPGDLGSFEAEKTSSLRSSLRRVRQGIKEATGAANPFVSTGTRLNARHAVPGWLAGMEAAPVPYMTGFRMSFRRAAIESTSFDVTLRRYAWFEDIDASFSAMRRGLVVVAGRARIYHHRAAAKRAGGRDMGRWAILNRAYVVMKHVHANPGVFPDPGREVSRLKRYCQARTAAYRLMARDGHGRDRAAGAAEGLRLLPQITAAAPEDLTGVYSRLTGD